METIVLKEIMILHTAHMLIIVVLADLEAQYSRSLQSLCGELLFAAIISNCSINGV